jgi:NAD-reducing hydrogenase small subunit
MAFLDLDERLLELARLVDFVASPIMDIKELPESDVTLVEGGVGTTADLHHLRIARRRSGILVALGDCAALAGIPTLRNPRSPREVLERAYLETESSATLVLPGQGLPELLPQVRPIQAYVDVDAWVPGCPPRVEAIWNALEGLLTGAPPPRPAVLRYD